MDKNSDRLTLVPYFPNEKQTLKWYQDPKICKQVDNIDKLVQLARIQKMTQVKAHIYDFNIQSKKMFTRMGFKEQQPDWYSYDLQIKNIHVTK